jgi:hypothetical protein
VGRHGVPFGAVDEMHWVPEHTALQVVSFPQIRPFMLAMPRLEIGKQAICPDGVLGSGRHTP